jgi:predicted esterase
MTGLYRDMDQVALDAAYNNGQAVADSAAILADFQRRSDALRASLPKHLDLPYGPGPRNRIDYFPAPGPGPVLVFIHGGYWQMQAKERFSFLAAGPLAHGMHVAMMGYTLAPDATLEQIVSEVRAAIGWVRQHAPALGGDAGRMVVSGWSAGAHLTAMSMAEQGVIGGLAISGIFDLEPIRLSYINRKLGLSAGEAAALSPMRLAHSPLPLVLAYGMDELPELQRQSEDYAAARAGLPGRALPLAGKNHFTILEELADPGGALTAQARLLAGL